jgi:TetR/AcrR family transcriptional repressor of nem operon
MAFVAGTDPGLHLTTTGHIFYFTMPRPSVREQLIETAFDRFHALGYNGCGVQEITDAAGVPKGSFYNHFKSKELLVCEVLERYCAASRLDMLAPSKVPPLQRLRAHFEFLAEPYDANGFMRGCLIGNLSTELSDGSPVVREALQVALGRWSDAIAALLREAQQRGELGRGLRPQPLARYLVSAWEGAVARMKVVKSGTPLDDFFVVTFNALLV